MTKTDEPQVSDKQKTHEEVVKTFRVIGENFIKLSELFASSANTGLKSKKRVRDENQPKKPLSSYIYFSVAQRNRIVKEHPEASNTQVATYLGQEWKKLTDKQKQPYINLAAKDKERYNTELKNYELSIVKAEEIPKPTEQEPKLKKAKLETIEPKKPSKKVKETKDTKESKKSKANEQKHDAKKGKKGDQSKSKKSKK